MLMPRNSTISVARTGYFISFAFQSRACFLFTLEIGKPAPMVAMKIPISRLDSFMRLVAALRGFSRLNTSRVCPTLTEAPNSLGGHVCRLSFAKTGFHFCRTGNSVSKMLAPGLATSTCPRRSKVGTVTMGSLGCPETSP